MILFDENLPHFQSAVYFRSQNNSQVVLTLQLIIYGNQYQLTRRQQMHCGNCSECLCWW